MSVHKRGNVWWYDFTFAGRRIQESTKSPSKTAAKLAEQKRKRQLELGINSIEDAREEFIRPLREVADEYLESYSLWSSVYDLCRVRGQARVNRPAAIALDSKQ